jgi:hypothetical protein
MDNNLKHIIKIADSAFKHCLYHGQPLPPVDMSEYITWDWNVTENEELVFYTDNHIQSPKHTHKRRIAWLIEPYCKQPHNYEWLKRNYHLYDMVITHDHEMLDVDDRFVFVPHCGAWIEHENRHISHIKTKLVSMITSQKRNVPDHHKRHELISRHKNIIDVMGRGYIPIEPISKGLIDYMFHIAMENQRRDFYFTEKLMNPLLVGTVPIYYGMPSIDKYFDTRGMILFNDINELNTILPELSTELYQSLQPYIKINYELASEYILAEDWMFKNGVIS